MRPGGTSHLHPPPPRPVVPSPPQVEAQLGPPGPLTCTSPRRQQMALWAQAGLQAGDAEGQTDAVDRPPCPAAPLNPERPAGQSVREGPWHPTAQGWTGAVGIAATGSRGPGELQGPPPHTFAQAAPQGSLPTAQALVLPREEACPGGSPARPETLSLPLQLHPLGLGSGSSTSGPGATPLPGPPAAWACSVRTLGHWGPARPCTPPAGVLPSPVSTPGVFAHGPGQACAPPPGPWLRARVSPLDTAPLEGGNLEFPPCWAPTHSRCPQSTRGVRGRGALCRG